MPQRWAAQTEPEPVIFAPTLVSAYPGLEGPKAELRVGGDSAKLIIKTT